MYLRGDGKEIGVIAALLEVHDDVEQRDLATAALHVEGVVVLRQHEFVVLP